MNIAVYLGSNTGNNPIYRQKVEELGAWIGRNGHTLVYGGSNIGLMGLLADAVLSCQGKVIGVEPRFFVEELVQHTGITELIVTETMSERKQKMMELGDAFIAFPGGIGTLEEISEVMTLAKLGRLGKPFCFFNVCGYYEPLRQFLCHMVTEGFLEEEWTKEICFVDTTAKIDEVLHRRKAGKI